MKEALRTIEHYAEAYSGMERLQKGKDAPFARGDQKTGVIAEFYGRVYAQSRYPACAVSYAKHSTKGYDLEIKAHGKVVRRIQVKAVSAYSCARKVSPIRSGWDDLYLLWLDKRFLPIRFTVITAASAKWASDTLTNGTMPGFQSDQIGSEELRGGEDKTVELQTLVGSETTPASTDMRCKRRRT